MIIPEFNSLTLNVQERISSGYRTIAEAKGQQQPELSQYGKRHTAHRIRSHRLLNGMLEERRLDRLQIPSSLPRYLWTSRTFRRQKVATIQGLAGTTGERLGL